MEGIVEEEDNEHPTNCELIPLNETNVNLNCTHTSVENEGNVTNEENMDPREKNAILRTKLIKLSIRIIFFGLVIALLSIIILSFRFALNIFIIRGKKFSLYYMKYFAKFVAIGVLLILYAVPLGLLLALIIVILYSAWKIKSENISVKNLKALQTIASITTICFSDNVLTIGDQVQQQVSQAIQVCERAGIVVRLITSGSIESARDIAENCSIIKTNQDCLVLDGKQFNERIRSSSGEVEQELFDQIWPNLRVLAGSSANDKYILVKHMIASKLNADREVVAVIGVEKSDGPALRKADIGLSLGVSGTDAAKIASNIILTDDKVSNIIRAVILGRNAYEIMAKFVHFQLTINLVLVIFSFIDVCVVELLPFGIIDVLWVQVVVGMFATIALTIETPNPSLMLRKPYGYTESLISRIMVKKIIGLAIYQLVVLLVLIFFSEKFLDSELYTSEPELTQHSSIIFNSFVLMSIFNVFNCRSIHRVKHCSVLSRNPLFYGILLIALIVHILIVQLVGSFLELSNLNLPLWLWCIAFGVGVLLWGQIITIIFKSICCNEKVESNVAHV